MAVQYDNVRHPRWTVRRPRGRKPLRIFFGQERGFVVPVQVLAPPPALLAVGVRLKPTAQLRAAIAA